MDREEMIRTLADEIADVLHGWQLGDYGNERFVQRDEAAEMTTEVIAALNERFGEGWFIGTPTDRRVLEAAAEWSIRHPFADGIATPTDYLLRAVWARRVALNGTESADA